MSDVREPCNGEVRWLTWEHYVCGDMGFPPEKRRKLQQYWNGEWREVKDFPDKAGAKRG